MHVIDTLKEVEVFSGHSDAQLQKLSRLASQRRVHAGDRIIVEGELPDELFVIESGEFAIIVEPAQGAHAATGISLVTLGRGQIVGEISLIDRGPRSATVQCVSDEATLLAFNLEELAALLDEDPTIGYLVMRNLAADMAFKLRQRNIREKLLP
jgi:CRP/FNR family transcriptional regulator, cyclic AMP receptor protein